MLKRPTVLLLLLCNGLMIVTEMFLFYCDSRTDPWSTCRDLLDIAGKEHVPLLLSLRAVTNGTNWGGNFGYMSLRLLNITPFLILVECLCVPG